MLFRSDRIAQTDDSEAAITALQEAVLADPRFSGDLRRAALIVVGEVDLDRQAKRAQVEAAKPNAPSPAAAP